MNVLDFEINICGCSHEELIQNRDLSNVIQVVKSCKMRAGGRNLLCAHSDMFPNDPDPFTLLISEASKKGNNYDVKILEELRQINSTVDNLVRASFIRGTYRSFQSRGLSESITIKYISFFDELEKIFNNSVGKNRDLNQGERVRFRLLVSKIQSVSRDILEGLSN